MKGFITITHQKAPVTISLRVIATITIEKDRSDRPYTIVTINLGGGKVSYVTEESHEQILQLLEQAQ